MEYTAVDSVLTVPICTQSISDFLVHCALHIKYHSAIFNVWSRRHVHNIIAMML